MTVRLDPTFHGYLDSLVEHAATALWPERRAALESFARGIAACPADQLEIAAERIPGEAAVLLEPAELLFRTILSAYLESLGEHEITNPDQALLYALSLESEHVALAEAWLEAHPEFRVQEETAEV